MKQTDRESRTRWIKLTAFFGVLAVLCVIGIFLPRPTESEIEKRKLTEFPAFTWESFWSGKWFSGIDTWYADTYPLRELLIGGNKVVQSLYGIRSDVIVGGKIRVRRSRISKVGRESCPPCRKMILKIRPMIPSRITIPSRPAMVM